MGIEITSLRDDAAEHQKELRSRISDLEMFLLDSREDQERAKVASDFDTK